MHYMLIYEIAPDYLERRPMFRAEHLARGAADGGELLPGGAVGEPVEGALLLFGGDSPAAAEAFARADPYVRNGLVARWRVAPWRTVVGPLAAEPVG